MTEDITVIRQGREWLFSDGTRLPVVSGAEGEEDPDPDLGDTIVIPAEPNGDVPPTARRQRTPRTFSEEDISKARQQEKDKLYGRLQEAEKIKADYEAMVAERKDREAAEAKAKKERDAAEKKKREEEMELRTLLDTRQAEWEQQLANERAERQRLQILFEKEQAFAQLQAYKAQRMEQEADAIMPELRDIIRGNTPDEIDASIELAKSKTEAIMGQFQQRQQAGRQAMTGPSVTAPPVGPLDAGAATQTYTEQDLRDMSLEDYAAVRDRLRSAAGAAYRGGRR